MNTGNAQGRRDALQATFGEFEPHILHHDSSRIDSNATRSTVHTGRRSIATGGKSREQGDAAGRSGTCAWQRREVTGESNTKILLVPAMPTRKAHHRGEPMGEARRARIPASQQPASPARKRGHRARRIASAHWLTFNQSGDREETKDHAGAAEESTGRTSAIPQGWGARQERKGHAASSKDGIVGA